ncbi:mersacidin family lantibiotic [Butyrivibrio sp. INlla21]|uniref:mersacidin family lantibiotic n=1 Tax=Butyrivibrio sp. INlla21 TaxID=1520811 RepID=UPI0008ED5A42|nr:lichenicidin A2 family type 2 lantibiotic [Butyrivibrio sp. INlla21]SFU96325.1 type 2 lantibiotic, SP_1948 family [Butyrivibrio sp. INlla21]
MAQEKINEVVGESFEDLKEDEMLQTQGAGDVDAETTPAITVSAAVVIGGSLGFEATVKVTKTCNGNCG